MAMSKAEQRAAAERILGKSPLTEEERQLAEMMKKRPGTYVPPTESGLRMCGLCGAEFQNDEEQTSLQKFADHQAEHNPSPAQWATAHKRIQAGKVKAEPEE